MKTTEIKGTFSLYGKVSIKFDAELTSHQSREILDAIGAVINDSWADGDITTVEKEKLSLARKPKADPDQTTIPLEDEPKVITDVPYTVTDSIEHKAVPEIEHLPEAEAEETEPEPSEDEPAF